MNIDSGKFKLIEWLESLTDSSIIQKVAEVRTQYINKEFDCNLPSINIHELKARAIESEEAIEKGKVTSLED